MSYYKVRSVAFKRSIGEIYVTCADSSLRPLKYYRSEYAENIEDFAEKCKLFWVDVLSGNFQFTKSNQWHYYVKNAYAEMHLIAHNIDIFSKDLDYRTNFYNELQEYVAKTYLVPLVTKEAKRIDIDFEADFAERCQKRWDEIDKERANAIVEIGRVLKHLDDTLEMGICALNGGLKDNAIPRECICDILVTPEDEKKLEDAVFALNHILKKEYQASDPDIVLRFEKLGTKKTQVLGYRSQSRILFFLRNMPNGIQHMNMEIPGLPETSLNAGIMKMTEEEFSVSFSVRSSVKSRKEEVMDRLSYLSEFLGGTVTFTGNYPAWEYKKDSKVRELVLDVYRDLYQKEPKIEAIHAGLECGILSEKIENLDCVSFGPDNFDIHTPKERLSISSTERVWKFILEFLKRAK